MAPVNISEVVERLGIEGEERDDEFFASCPMHEARTGHPDSNPSWSINLETGAHFCFSCHYRGNVYRLIADLADVSYEEAEDWVPREDFQSAVQKIGPAFHNLPKPRPITEARLAVFVDPPWWAMNGRELTDSACLEYGVKWDGDESAWILPFRNPRDHSLMGWQVKSAKTREFRNYPASIDKSKTLFGIDGWEPGPMVVVESPLDAVRIHSLGLGYHTAVAVCGSYVSKDQLLLMRAADEIIFALDNDKSGKKESLRLLDATRGLLRNVSFFNYTGIAAKDVGDMASEEIVQGLTTARSRVLGDLAVIG